MDPALRRRLDALLFLCSGIFGLLFTLLLFSAGIVGAVLGLSAGSVLAFAVLFAVGAGSGSGESEAPADA